jgi:hypothetical protein
MSKEAGMADWKSNPVVGVVLVVVIVIAIALAVKTMMPAKYSYPITLQCAKCPPFTTRLVAGGKSQIKCPHCGGTITQKSFEEMKREGASGMPAMNCSVCGPGAVSVVPAGDVPSEPGAAGQPETTGQ